MMSDDLPSRRSAALEGYARSGINAASVGVSLGFGAATTGTKIGFGIARGITTTAVNIGSALFDYAWGTDVNTGATLNAAIVRGLRFAETLVLTPMHIGETIASSSLVAASSTLDALAKLLGSEEPSFTLGAFVQLVRREWNDPVMAEFLPEKRISLWDTTRALVAWASLQAVTWDFAQRRTLSVLTLVPKAQWAAPLPAADSLTPSAKDIHVTSNVQFPDQSGELMTAEIGEASSSSTGSVTPPVSDAGLQPSRLDYPLLRANLRRCSKLALGSYGGAGMIFFGIPMPTPTPDNVPNGTAADIATVASPPARADDATTLVDVVQEAEVESQASPPTNPQQRRFWDIVWGKHDREIFESFVLKDESGEVPYQKATATVGAEEYLPRFWILTDHGRKQVVLVLRGTMSFKELAIDLTCEAIDFTIGHSFSDGLGPESQPGHAESSQNSTHKVHSGIWKIAQEMGDVGRPVTRAVAAALKKNKGYDLVLCGHSLGAGIAVMLALMWADPTTCRTIPSSGLPGDRRVSAYCFAPPCVTSPELSRLCSSLIVSFVFSQDLVARLSLGSVRDLVRCSWWLCYETKNPSESSNIMTRIASYQSGGGTPEEREEISQQFIALRKTLEANMHMADLFPTGRVLIALRQSDLPSDHQSNTDPEEEFQMYEVDDVEIVFGQITFARDMLSCHLPHHYDQVLHEFL
ncbi:alpha/beta-hydrolase [Calocera viscosa TUFC12733]|uniref:sn-1-specific diacylglycerol lipase n=1 Tax=Calocera viscosa (strain TUFC12733) TaxID=1330018 RepID=A0A167JP54_CALVF|nr:alpha/beta-hydrolase [Calocera viscosa TUFC12733]